MTRVMPIRAAVLEVCSPRPQGRQPGAMSGAIVEAP